MAFNILRSDKAGCEYNRVNDNMAFQTVQQFLSLNIYKSMKSQNTAPHYSFVGRICCILCNYIGDKMSCYNCTVL